MNEAIGGTARTDETVANFRLDGVIHRKMQEFREEVRLAKDQIVAMARRAANAMKSAGRRDPTRGPDPGFDEFEDEEIRRFSGLIERLAQRLSARSVNFNNGNGGLTKGAQAALWSLVAAGVCGLVVMYGKLSAIEANQVSQQRQLDALAALVSRRP